jgi:hypothetical protein
MEPRLLIEHGRFAVRWPAILGIDLGLAVFADGDHVCVLATMFHIARGGRAVKADVGRPSDQLAVVFEDARFARPTSVQHPNAESYEEKADYAECWNKIEEVER